MAPHRWIFTKFAKDTVIYNYMGSYYLKYGLPFGKDAVFELESFPTKEYLGRGIFFTPKVLLFLHQILKFRKRFLGIKLV